ncbi:bifunctional chitinase/lysozyme [Spiroplasma sp. TIUS-1]|uniref:lipoprotein n=1 Tax=Spiroplasma sp. TIUS-1 TaxID=216963 RepID=UPI00139894F8|nr:lipoprotein [Spiroplasma sp. TIUS-1]QHX35856.1 bifunctional chitinase/lysozyme [Spiroplasma sp. TIUS-1]
MKKLLSILSTITLVGASTTTIIACSPQNDIFPSGENSWWNNTETGFNDSNVINKMMNKVSRSNEGDKILTQDQGEGVSNFKKSLKDKNNNGLLKSTLAGKNKNILDDSLLIKNAKDIRFKPYADIGIVEDYAEYALKWHNKSGAWRSEVIKEAEKLGIDNVNFNNLANIVNNKDLINLDNGGGINLGFMQNASDTGELTPMWDAAPSKTTNKSEEWFKDRFDKWSKDSNGNISKNMTISFGPFANSFWHTAYNNGSTAEQLAEQLKMIGENYNSKSFDFYFAAPYLSAKQPQYKESQKLLASALKILMETDAAENNGKTTWDIRLSLVGSNVQGLGFSPSMLEGNEAGFEEHNADESSPLYVFTKYLGTNFKLNLVAGYLSEEDSELYPNNLEKLKNNENWELKFIKNQIQVLRNNWIKLSNVLNGTEFEQSKLNWNQSTGIVNEEQPPLTDDEKDFSKRMIVTPWMGARAEKAMYNFTPKDMAELREFSIEQNIGELSMFYITRDHGSEFLSSLTEDEKNNLSTTNSARLADKNALDQNIRSGSGFYDEYSYTKALNGKLSKSDVENLKHYDTFEEAKINGIKGLIDLESIKVESEFGKFVGSLGNDAVWEGPGNGGPGTGENGGNTDPVPPTGEQGPAPASPSLYKDRLLANPVRGNSQITKKVAKNSGVYFSPYLDAGLWEGNEIAAIKGASNLDHLTLSFAQQINSKQPSNPSEDMEISFAGIDKGNEGYDYWLEAQLKAKVLDPLVKQNPDNLKNIKVAYGGATTGGYDHKNPWSLAAELYGNDATNRLEKSLVDFQNEISGLYGKSNIMKSIDFDIEGEAQNNHEGITVLAKTLAQMKKADKSWDFSITLPVLPQGLTNVGYGVLDIFVKEYKNAGLDIKDLPITNLMLMDYGDPIYLEAISKNETNFDLAKAAIENTFRNIENSIKENFNIEGVKPSNIWKLIGATPMIGVNDTVAGVFTEEDAKELYNYAHTVGLGYIGMWSMNDDRGRQGDKAINKSLVTHGLAYLDEYVFASAFNGNWDYVKKHTHDKWYL